MGIDAQLDRIESLLERILSILESKTDSEKLEALIEKVAARKPVKDFYSTAEVAEIVGRSEFQVRHWCKTGRILAKKRASGRGHYKEWAISHEAVVSYQSLGLRPVEKPKG